MSDLDMLKVPVVNDGDYIHAVYPEAYWLSLCESELNQQGTLIVDMGIPTCPECYELVFGVSLYGDDED